MIRMTRTNRPQRRKSNAGMLETRSIQPHLRNATLDGARRKRMQKSVRKTTHTTGWKWRHLIRCLFNGVVILLRHFAPGPCPRHPRYLPHAQLLAYPSLGHRPLFTKPPGQHLLLPLSLGCRLSSSWLRVPSIFAFTPALSRPPSPLSQRPSATVLLLYDHPKNRKSG